MLFDSGLPIPHNADILIICRHQAQVNCATMIFMNHLRSVAINDAWLRLWLVIDAFDRVQQVLFQPPTGEITYLKNHPYRQLFRQYMAGDYQALNQIKINLPTGDFRRAVLEQMRQIPAGQTLSYGQLANLTGYPGAARAVGSICKHNPLPIIIPCHRIIKSNGSLGEYAFGAELKKQLLHHEGVNF